MPKTLSFSVKGEYITQQAREWLAEGKWKQAWELIASCTESEEMTEEEHEHLIFQILDGACEIKGTYPGDDYRIEETEGAGRIGEVFEALREQKETLKKQVNQKNEQLAYLLKYLQEEMPCTLNDLAEEFEKEYGYELLPKTTYENMFHEKNPLLEEYLEVQASEERDSEYGWLEPDGTFHPVPWGEHEEWAGDYLEEHYPEEQHPELYIHAFPHMGKRTIVGGDVLTYSLGWICIDNPAQGKGRPKAIGKPMTKDQKEYLYDYYIKRGRRDEANELYKEE